MMDCKHCGFVLTNAVKFCNSCGKPQGAQIEPTFTSDIKHATRGELKNMSPADLEIYFTQQIQTIKNNNQQNMNNVGSTTLSTSFWSLTLIFFCVGIAVTSCGGKSDAEKQVDAQATAVQKAEDTRKGFHCLSGWNGAHAGVEKYVKANLRDPDSYDHIETRITPVNERGEHALVMKYRAKNGFGGMNVESLVATIKNEGCKATIM